MNDESNAVKMARHAYKHAEAFQHATWRAFRAARGESRAAARLPATLRGPWHATAATVETARDSWRDADCAAGDAHWVLMRAESAAKTGKIS